MSTSSAPVAEPSPIPSPAEAMERLVRLAAGNPDIIMKPTLKSETWKAAVATDKGQIRADNQDYGLTFCVADRCVVVIGDGVGGQPEGGRASYLAVTAAAGQLMHYLGRHPQDEDLPALVHQAMLSAASALTQEGANTGRGGLRTTLIIVVATPTAVFFSHIGDGGGAVVRADGSVEQFVAPQTMPGTQNVLSACLGPITEGAPLSGRLPWRPGDFLMAGTDGVFSYVDQRFIPDIAAALKTYQGDVEAVAATAVRNLAEAMDGPFVCCEDNLTLALVMHTAPAGDNSHVAH